MAVAALGEAEVIRMLLTGLALRPIRRERVARHHSYREQADRLAHVDGAWTAQSADANTFESWFGSMLLVEACALGELPIEDLLNRIDQKTWFAAARRLGTDFAEPMAKSFLQRLRGGVKAVDKLSPPPADLTLTNAEPAPYSRRIFFRKNSRIATRNSGNTIKKRLR